jgi:hypothetical protein
MYVYVNRNQKSLCQLSGTDRIVGIKVVAGWFRSRLAGGLISEAGKQIECATMEATVVWVNQKTANFLRDFKGQ